MSQNLTKRQEDARRVIYRLAPHLIRIARTFVQCVTAPNRDENPDGEAAFADALFDFTKELDDSKLL